MDALEREEAGGGVPKIMPPDIEKFREFELPLEVPPQVARR
jgi:hypothetical protein